jgi:predicted TIM-barrel fold metal-dependent hydrolase
MLDAHAEISDDLGAAALIRLMDAAKVDRAVVSAAATDCVPPLRAAPLKVMRTLLRSPFRSLGLSRLDRLARRGGLHFADRFVRIRHVVSNAAAFDAAAQSAGRLIPFAVVTPHTNPSAAHQLETWIAERRIAGACAFAWFHALEPGRDLAAIGRHLERAHLPLHLQLGANPRTSDFQSLRAACPRLTIILAHGAMPLLRTAWDSVRNDARLFIDLSGPWLDAATTRAAVRTVGAHKAVFASHAPTSLRAPGRAGESSYAAAFERLDALGLRAREMDLIRGETMASILENGGA